LERIKAEFGNDLEKSKLIPNVNIDTDLLKEMSSHWGKVAESMERITKSHELIVAMLVSKDNELSKLKGSNLEIEILKVLDPLKHGFLQMIEKVSQGQVLQENQAAEVLNSSVEDFFERAGK